MQLSDLPTRFAYAFAYMAAAGYTRVIPETHQTPSGTDAPANLYDGFQQLNFSAVGAGGIPPSGQDFNGILNQVTAGMRWLQGGGQAVYNSTFATKIGGYPKGAILLSSDGTKQWICTADNNTSDPDAAGANWRLLSRDPLTNANYFYHPNGALEQWGKTLLTSTGEPVVATSLYIAYSNAAYDIQMTPLIYAPNVLCDTWVQVIESTVTASGFSAQYQHAQNGGNPNLDGYRWRTIGY
jgi:hypothetical protein